MSLVFTGIAGLGIKPIAKQCREVSKRFVGVKTPRGASLAGYSSGFTRHLSAPIDTFFHHKVGGGGDDVAKTEKTIFLVVFIGQVLAKLAVFCKVIMERSHLPPLGDFIITGCPKFFR